MPGHWAHLEVRDTGLPGHSLLLVLVESAASRNASRSCGWMECQAQVTSRHGPPELEGPPM